MTHLTLGIEQLAILMNPLYATLPAPPPVGFFNPFTFLAPVMFKAIFSGHRGLLYKKNGHELSLA
jgi:hypothetical protein